MTWPVIAGASLFAFIALSIIIYVTTDKGRIKIVVDGPKAIVKVDGEEVRIEALGEPMTLRAGPHELSVKWGDGEFKTRSFGVRRGDNEALRVEYEPTRDGLTLEPDPKTDGPNKTPNSGRPALLTAPFDDAAARRAQMAWANYLNTPLVVTNSIGMKLTLIPAGEFQMGSPYSDGDATSDENPQHRVRISKPFYLGVYEVMRGQFRQFVEATSYRTEAEKDGKGGWGWNETKGDHEGDPRYTWLSPGFDQTDDHPVGNVSWNDAVAFSQWLSRTEGKIYRLPAEAEWEYACRAGTTTKYFSGDDPEKLATIANVADGTAKAKFPPWRRTIAARDGFVQSAPVGRFRPNAFGLYDMHGNVFEWCSDGYDADYYKQSPVDDPRGAERAAPRVFRGGGWVDQPAIFRSANREAHWPGYRSGHVGFRLALYQAETQWASNTIKQPAGISAPSSDKEPPAGGAGGLSTSPVEIPTPAPPGKLPGSPTEALPHVADITRDGFQRLFNGENLAGWKTSGNPDHLWKVVNGSIVSVRPPTWSRLDTTRANFANFHLRVETKLAEGNDAGIDFRMKQSENESDFYVTVIPGSRTSGRNAGDLDLWISGHRVDLAKASAVVPIQPGEWFTCEVIADGNAITVLVQGKEVVKYKDPNQTLASGSLGLFCRGDSSVMFRKVEIKELTTLPTTKPVPIEAGASAGQSASTPASPPENKDRLTRSQPGLPSSTDSKPNRVPGEAKSAAPLSEARKPAPARGKSKPAGQPPIHWTSPSTKMAFVRVEGGEFMMGSPEGDQEAESDERPQHTVRISPFYLGVTEVTQEQYVAVTGNNPSLFSLTGAGRNLVADRPTDRHPVESVSWLDAIGFCNALSGYDRLKPYYKVEVKNDGGMDVSVPDARGPGYRLPYEAEWEYACRAHARTKYSFGDVFPELEESPWHSGNTDGKTNFVGWKRANAFGLYDMHGNLWELCWDGYGDNYYGGSPMLDPTGPPRATKRVVRGGSWRSLPRSCRSAERAWRGQDARGSDVGFRVARNQAGR